MGRTLSGASYDRNDYVLQPHNGGSGCASVEELKERYGMIRENEFNTPGGVLAYDEKGNVPTSSLPSQILTRPSTYIKGAVSIVPGGTSTYKISNYNESTTYNVSFNGGSATITGDTITITAGNTAGVYELVINNEKYQLAIATSLPRDVIISTHALLTSDLANVILSIKTSVTIDNGANHFATDYQVATDEDFQNVVFFEQMSPNKTEARFVVSKQSQYFIRARAIDSYKQKSVWSNVTSYELANISAGVGTPSSNIKLFKDSSTITAIVGTSAFYSESGQEFSHLEVKVYSDSLFSNQIGSAQFSDISEPKFFKFNTASENLYVRLRHVSKSGAASGWTKAIYKKASEIFSSVPTVRRNQFFPRPTVNGTDSYISRQSYMSPNGKWLVVVDGVYPEAYLYHKKDNAAWVLDSTFTDVGFGIDNNSKGFIACVTNTGNEVILASNTNDSKSRIDIIKRVNNLWTKVQTIDTSSFVVGTLGSELDISRDGNTLFTGSNRIGATPFIGKGHYFKRNAQGLFDGPFFIENPTTGHLDDAFGDFGVFNETSDRLVISAWRENAATTEQGAIYIYSLVNGNWVFESKHTPASLGITVNYVGLNFGYFIRTKGDRIAVGMRGYVVDGFSGSRHGAVAILKKSGQSWALESIIRSPYEPKHGHNFGYNFDINDAADRIAIGSSPNIGTYYDVTDPAFVAIFERSDTVWNHVYSHKAIVTGTVFGRSVNISALGTDLAIISKKDTFGGSDVSVRAGAVAMYSSQEKKYEHRQRLTLPGTNQTGRIRGLVLRNGEFVALVNPNLKYAGATSAGYVIIFKRAGLQYVQHQVITSDTTGKPTYTLMSREINKDVDDNSFNCIYGNNTAGVGSPNVIERFVYNSVTGLFDIRESITISTPDGLTNRAGHIVRFSQNGKIMIVTAPTNGKVSKVGGFVLVYDLIGPTWTLRQKIDQTVTSGIEYSAAFGVTMDMAPDGSSFAVSKFFSFENGVAVNMNSLYYFKLDTADNLFKLIKTVDKTTHPAVSRKAFRQIKYSTKLNGYLAALPDDHPTKTPAVYLFKYNAGDVTFDPIINSDIDKSIGTFGFSSGYSEDGSIVAVGAPDRNIYIGNSIIGDRKGEIVIFKNSGYGYKNIAKVTGIMDGDRLGINTYTSADGGTVLGIIQPSIDITPYGDNSIIYEVFN